MAQSRNSNQNASDQFLKNKYVRIQIAQTNESVISQKKTYRIRNKGYKRLVKYVGDRLKIDTDSATFELQYKDVGEDEMVQIEGEDDFEVADEICPNLKIYVVTSKASALVASQLAELPPSALVPSITDSYGTTSTMGSAMESQMGSGNSSSNREGTSSVTSSHTGKSGDSSDQRSNPPPPDIGVAISPLSSLPVPLPIPGGGAPAITHNFLTLDDIKKLSTPDNYEDEADGVVADNISITSGRSFISQAKLISNMMFSGATPMTPSCHIPYYQANSKHTQQSTNAKAPPTQHPHFIHNPTGTHMRTTDLARDVHSSSGVYSALAQHFEGTSGLFNTSLDLKRYVDECIRLYHQQLPQLSQQSTLSPTMGQTFMTNQPMGAHQSMPQTGNLGWRYGGPYASNGGSVASSLSSAQQLPPYAPQRPYHAGGAPVQSMVPQPPITPPRGRPFAQQPPYGPLPPQSLSQAQMAAAAAAVQQQQQQSTPTRQSNSGSCRVVSMAAAMAVELAKEVKNPVMVMIKSWPIVARIPVQFQKRDELREELKRLLRPVQPDLCDFQTDICWPLQTRQEWKYVKLFINFSQEEYQHRSLNLPQLKHGWRPKCDPKLLIKFELCAKKELSKSVESKDRYWTISLGFVNTMGFDTGVLVMEIANRWNGYENLRQRPSQIIIVPKNPWVVHVNFINKRARDRCMNESRGRVDLFGQAVILKPSNLPQQHYIELSANVRRQQLLLLQQQQLQQQQPQQMNDYNNAMSRNHLYQTRM